MNNDVTLFNFNIIFFTLHIFSPFLLIYSPLFFFIVVIFVNNILKIAFNLTFVKILIVFLPFFWLCNVLLTDSLSTCKIGKVILLNAKVYKCMLKSLMSEIEDSLSTIKCSIKEFCLFLICWKPLKIKVFHDIISLKFNWWKKSKTSVIIPFRMLITSLGILISVFELDNWSFWNSLIRK